MVVLRRFADGLASRLRWVAEAAIVAMMLLTCSDVALRLFDFPVKGVYDLVSVTASAAIAFALAYTGTERAHVSVSFVTDLLPRWLRLFVFRLTRLLSAAFFAVIGWQSWLYAGELLQSKEVTPTLRMPFYPFVYGIALGAAALALVLLADIVSPPEGEFERRGE